MVAIMLIAVMSMSSVVAFASNEGISPYLYHADRTDISFVASSSGGYVDVRYYGYDSFVRADLTVKIQKRFLWAFWNDVTEWSASSTEVNGHFYNTLALNGSGTYKATFTLKITGTDGTVDTIEQTIQSKY